MILGKFKASIGLCEQVDSCIRQAQSIGLHEQVVPCDIRQDQSIGLQEQVASCDIRQVQSIYRSS